MPICESKRCPFEGEWQDESEFNGNRWCRTCRQRNKRKSYGRSNSNATKIAWREELKIGDPPKFVADWHKRMWEGWLKDLVKGVQSENLQG